MQHIQTVERVLKWPWGGQLRDTKSWASISTYERSCHGLARETAHPVRALTDREGVHRYCDRCSTDEPYGSPLREDYIHMLRTSAFRFQVRACLHAQTIADYSRAIQLHPKHMLAYNGRGTAYEREGDAARAAADFDQASALNSHLPSDNEARVEE